MYPETSAKSLTESNDKTVPGWRVTRGILPFSGRTTCARRMETPSDSLPSGCDWASTDEAPQLKYAATPPPQHAMRITLAASHPHVRFPDASPTEDLLPQTLYLQRFCQYYESQSDAVQSLGMQTTRAYCGSEA